LVHKEYYHTSYILSSHSLIYASCLEISKSWKYLKVKELPFVFTWNFFAIYPMDCNRPCSQWYYHTWTSVLFSYIYFNFSLDHISSLLQSICWNHAVNEIILLGLLGFTKPDMSSLLQSICWKVSIILDLKSPFILCKF